MIQFIIGTLVTGIGGYLIYRTCKSPKPSQKPIEPKNKYRPVKTFPHVSPSTEFNVCGWKFTLVSVQRIGLEEVDQIDYVFRADNPDPYLHNYPLAELLRDRAPLTYLGYQFDVTSVTKYQSKAEIVLTCRGLLGDRPNYGIYYFKAGEETHGNP